MSIRSFNKKFGAKRQMNFSSSEKSEIRTVALGGLQVPYSPNENLPLPIVETSPAYFTGELIQWTLSLRCFAELHSRVLPVLALAALGFEGKRSGTRECERDWTQGLETAGLRLERHTVQTPRPRPRFRTIYRPGYLSLDRRQA